MGRTQGEVGLQRKVREKSGWLVMWLGGGGGGGSYLWLSSTGGHVHT
jgi:hypothetical protein